MDARPTQSLQTAFAMEPVSASLPLPARERTLSDVGRGRQLRATADADDEHFSAMHAWTVARTWSVKLRQHWKQQRDGTVYVCLLLLFEGMLFPVVAPHLSLGIFRFASDDKQWSAFRVTQAHLDLAAGRAPGVHVQRYGRGLHFAVSVSSPLFWMAKLFSEVCTARAEELVWVPDPHISWHPPSSPPAVWD